MKKDLSRTRVVNFQKKITANTFFRGRVLICIQKQTKHSTFEMKILTTLTSVGEFNLESQDIEQFQQTLV